MSLGLVLIAIGAVGAFLLAQAWFNRLAVKEERAAAEAIEQTRVYSREGLVYWLDKAREHEDRARAIRRLAAWPLKPKEPS